jgi:hypothetical protein
MIGFIDHQIIVTSQPRKCSPPCPSVESAPDS